MKYTVGAMFAFYGHSLFNKCNGCSSICFHGNYNLFGLRVCTADTADYPNTRASELRLEVQLSNLGLPVMDNMV
jgi:hypothetical protein